MRAVLAVAAVELRRFLKDRSTIFFVFLLPIVLVVLIGAQFGGGTTAGHVTLSGPDGALRQTLAESLREDDVEVVEVSGQGADDDVRERLARGRTDVGVFLGPDDERRFGAGQDLRLDVVTASRATATLTRQRVETAVRRLAVEQAQVEALRSRGLGRVRAAAAIEAAVAATSAPQLRVTGPDQEVEEEFAGLGRFDLGAATQTLLFVFVSSLTGATTLIQGRWLGVVRRVLSAPLSSRGVVTGQALGRLAIALVQGLYVMVGSALLFDVDWGSWAASLLVLLAFSSVAAACAMCIGALVDNEGAASGVGVGAGLVLGALGGCMTPLEFFPDTLQRVAHVTPHAWAYDAFATVQREGGGVLDVLPQVGVLAAMAAVALLVGSWALRRSLARGG